MVMFNSLLKVDLRSCVQLSGQVSQLSNRLHAKNRSQTPQMLPSALSLLREAAFFASSTPSRITKKFIKHSKGSHFICGLTDRVLNNMLKYTEMKYYFDRLIMRYTFILGFLRNYNINNTHKYISIHATGWRMNYSCSKNNL